MSTLGDVVSWFGESTNWQGRSGVPSRLAEHLRFSASAVAGATIVAAPIAAWLGHRRRFSTLAINVANVGQTLPSFAILVLAVQVVEFRELPFVGSLALFIAMALLAIPSVFINTYTGVAQVDDALRDAARGSGMTARQQLWRVELPVAAPVMLTGIRIAFVQVIATATLGAYVGVGGLGRYIIDGFAIRDYAEVFAGALLVAVLAIVVDRVIAGVQRVFLVRFAPGQNGARTTRRAPTRPIA
ncbi:MAG TPA: ABC transporter permease [Acidimicrobiales bacterium]